MAAVSEGIDGTLEPLRPGVFCRQLLDAMVASEGRRRRRKRDTTPDALGMSIKRDLMERAAAEDPEPEAFEAWLLGQVLSSPVGGPVRAMCAEILDEYRVAHADPTFGRWLAEGARSEDADADDEPRGERHAEPRRRDPLAREDQFAREERQSQRRSDSMGE